MSARRDSSLSDDAIRKASMRGQRRRGLYGGVYGVSYVGQSYYLNPDQFGYTTSQADGGYGGGSLTTTGSADGGGGDGGGTA